MVRKKLRGAMQRHAAKIHKGKTALEAFCFAAVAGGFHTVESALAGMLGVCLFVSLIIGEEA